MGLNSCIPQGWISDSDEAEKFESDSDGEVSGNLGRAGSPIAPSRNQLGAPGPSMLHDSGKINGAGPSASLVEHFVGKGLIKENGDGGAKSLLELLLTYKAISSEPSVDNCSASGCGPRTVDENNGILTNRDAQGGGRSSNRDRISDDSDDEDFLQGISQKDEKIKSLVRMGFPKDEAEMAVVRCGQDAPMSVLVDLIYTSEASEDGYYGHFSYHEDNSYGRRKEKRKRFEGAEEGSRGPLDSSSDEPMPLPNPMVGFNLPNQRLRSVDRCLPSKAIGPPFFYYENVAIAPKGVWTMLSRFLYDIQPEFVDSRFFFRDRG